MRIYAPVIIPTLCRYEHFKRCIESLSSCVDAEKTEVFIGLDQPLKESHREGYLKIKTYLNNCNHLNFKQIHVIHRERNYGVGANGNAEHLMKEVLAKYDRFIFTEDDNIFSPNFLIFQNMGLKKFKEDHSVLAINGYRHFYHIKLEGNTFYRQNVDFSAWGFGMWKDRYEMVCRLNNHYFLEQFTVKNIQKVFLNGARRVRDFCIACRKDPMPFTDSMLSVYAALNGMNVIMPSISLVRNLGVDGSGENFKKIFKELEQEHSTQQISDSRDFVFIGDGYEHYSLNRQIHVKSNYSRLRAWKVIPNILRISIYKWIRF